MLKDRIRKYLPVVLDLETGGLDNKKNPILEIAVQLLEYRDNNFELGELIRYHIEPFKDLEIDCFRKTSWFNSGVSFLPSKPGVI